MSGVVEVFAAVWFVPARFCGIIKRNNQAREVCCEKFLGGTKKSSGK
jgi:hypothetical protein